MKGIRFFRSAVVALAAIGAVLPTQVVRADQNAVQTVVGDVVLVGGALQGRVVDDTGAAMEGTVVVVRQNGTEVSRSVAAKDGTFTVAGLRGGVYSINAGNAEGVFRVWNERTAPPAAKSGITLVNGNAPIRGQNGQFGGINRAHLVLGAIGVTGVALGGAALYRANHPKSP